MLENHVVAAAEEVPRDFRQSVLGLQRSGFMRNRNAGSFKVEEYKRAAAKN
jgi:hypothetical protein